MDKSCWNQIFFFCLSLSICFSLSKPHPSISIWELLLPQLDMTQQDCHSWCQECGYMTLTRSIIPYFSVFQRLKKKIRWNLVAGIGDKGSILTETDIYQLFTKKKLRWNLQTNHFTVCASVAPGALRMSHKHGPCLLLELLIAQTPSVTHRYSTSSSLQDACCFKSVVLHLSVCVC